MARKHKSLINLLGGICLFCLLATPAWAAEEPAIQVEVLAKSNLSWDGNPLPAYPVANPEVTILRIKIPAGAQLPRHRHPVINAGVLVSGELTVLKEDGQTLHLRAGDPIVEVVNTWHSGKNEGALPAEIIVFYAGERETPITVKP